MADAASRSGDTHGGARRRSETSSWTAPRMQPVPDAEIVVRWCRAGLDGLALAREEIDALNVYPVPDGDTGTNLYLTMEAAVAAASATAAGDWSAGSLAVVVEAAAEGALLGARGNSGIILAQMLRGVADVLSVPGTTLADGSALARGLRRAADQAHRAVAEPVEGTILSVVRAAADAAELQAARTSATLADVALAAARAARVALARTPEQLDVLGAAGVVDAGGRGLCVLLDAFDTVLTGRRPLPRPRRMGEHLVPSPTSSVPLHPPAHESPAYEVMYLLDAPGPSVDALRVELAALGDSLVVVGGGPTDTTTADTTTTNTTTTNTTTAEPTTAEPTTTEPTTTDTTTAEPTTGDEVTTWNVHVHVDDAGAALEAGLRAGRPHRISVTYLHGSRPVAVPMAGRDVVALAAGDGLATLFAEAGATVVPTSRGHRPSTAELVAAVRGSGAGEVVVLPNERDAVPVAEAAAAEARAEGLRVAVIPTVAQVQGLAALAVHEPGRAFDADVVAMTAAAGHTRHGAVTVATRAAVTMAGVCEPGDVLGVVEGDFAILGSDLLAVATDVVARMLAAGGELVTVVTGADADPALAAGLVEAVGRDHPEADTVVYAGGQSRYPVLLGVE